MATSLIFPPTALLASSLPTPSLNNPSYPVHLCLICALTANFALSLTSNIPVLPTLPLLFSTACFTTPGTSSRGILGNSSTTAASNAFSCDASRFCTAAARVAAVARESASTAAAMDDGQRRPMRRSRASWTM